MFQKNGNTVRPARGRELSVRRHDRQHGGRANRATAAVFCWERAARSMQLSVVRPSVRLSVPFAGRTTLRWVCCCGPSGQETSIDSGGGPAQQLGVRRANAGSSSSSAYVLRLKTNTCFLLIPCANVHATSIVFSGEKIKISEERTKFSNGGAEALSNRKEYTVGAPIFNTS